MSLMFRLLVLTFLLSPLLPEGRHGWCALNRAIRLWGRGARLDDRTLSDGTTRADPQVGPTPKGYMIYGDANRMCAQFTNPARPNWTSTTEPTYEELRSMIDFMGAYCSRYEVNVAEGYVLHHVEIDRIPNFSNQYPGGTSGSRGPIVSCLQQSRHLQASLRSRLRGSG